LILNYFDGGEKNVLHFCNSIISNHLKVKQQRVQLVRCWRQSDM
jgi:hypothetical protein